VVPPKIKAHVTWVSVHGALDADDTGTTVAITTRAAPIDTVIRVAVRRTFPIPSAAANGPDATDVLCVTHRRSSTWFLAKRWPTASGVEFRDPNRRSGAV
jgi:hypothetical protein